VLIQILFHCRELWLGSKEKERKVHCKNCKKDERKVYCQENQSIVAMESEQVEKLHQKARSHLADFVYGIGT